MNLKRLRGIETVALITIAAALFAGCSNSLAGSIDESTVENSNARMATLSISATGIPNDYAEQIRKAYANAGARSIVPNSPYKPNSNGLKFYLSGSSNTVELDDMEVKLKDKDENTWELTTTDGKPITLESRSWTLVLTAYKSYPDTKVLRGFCTVDLRSGSGSASFVMGTAGLTDNGSVALGGTIVDTDEAAAVYTMGIYRMDTGEAVTGTVKDDTLDTGNDGENESFTYPQVSVAPGTYWYKMIFYAETEKKTIVGSFMDTIIVEPGNDLAQGSLIIDVIGRKPKLPTNLKAYLINDKESSDGKTYDVKVTWTQADYATNYELNIVEFDGNADVIDTTFGAGADGLIPGGAIYGMASMDKTNTVKDFMKSEMGVKNSSTALMYGTSSCILTLETGKLYEIQLRARNYIGVSDWVDRVAGDVETGYTAYAAPSNQRINRLLITYNLGDGTLKIPGSAPCTEYAKYYSWKAGDDSDLLAPVTTATTENDVITLVNGGSVFAEWKLQEGTAVRDTGIVTVADTNRVVNKYTYKNATVKAFYGNTVALGVSAEEQTTYIKASDVVVTYGVSPNINIGPDAAADGTAALIIPIGDRASPNSVQVSLTPASANADSPYKNVKFSVLRQGDTKDSQTTQSNKYCTFSTSGYEPGEKVSVIIKATDAKTGKLVSYTVTLLMK